MSIHSILYRSLYIYTDFCYRQKIFSTYIIINSWIKQNHHCVIFVRVTCSACAWYNELYFQPSKRFAVAWRIAIHTLILYDVTTSYATSFNPLLLCELSSFICIVWRNMHIERMNDVKGMPNQLFTFCKKVSYVYKDIRAIYNNLYIVFWIYVDSYSISYSI